MAHDTMAYVIKAEVRDPGAAAFTFTAQKTMYGGKHVAAGDTIFVFASENSGGHCLVARGVVTEATAFPRHPGIARQTPRITLTIRRTGLAKRPLGRADLKPFSNWSGGQPQTELNFKLYRQATDKVVGVTEATATWLEGWF